MGSSFKFQVFISQRPQLGYMNNYKQYNIEQNKAMSSNTINYLTILTSNWMVTN